MPGQGLPGFLQNRGELGVDAQGGMEKPQQPEIRHAAYGREGVFLGENASEFVEKALAEEAVEKLHLHRVLDEFFRVLADLEPHALLKADGPEDPGRVFDKA